MLLLLDSEGSSPAREVDATILGMPHDDAGIRAASILEPGGSAGLRAALEALELGCAMLLEQLRREHPKATEEELQDLFLKYMAERPLDGPGRRVPFPDAGADA